jgi:hypothetical protein
MFGARRRPASMNSYFEWTGFWQEVFRRLIVAAQEFSLAEGDSRPRRVKGRA